MADNTLLILAVIAVAVIVLLFVLKTPNKPQLRMGDGYCSPSWCRTLCGSNTTCLQNCNNYQTCTKDYNYCLGLGITDPYALDQCMKVTLSN